MRQRGEGDERDLHHNTAEIVIHMSLLTLVLSVQVTKAGFLVLLVNP